MTLGSSRISLSVLSGIRTAQPQWCNGTNCRLRYRVSYLQFALSWFRYAKVHYFNIKQHWKIPLTARQRIAAKNSEKSHCLWLAYEEVPQDLQCRNMDLCVCVYIHCLVFCQQWSRYSRLSDVSLFLLHSCCQIIGKVLLLRYGAHKLCKGKLFHASAENKSVTKLSFKSL